MGKTVITLTSCDTADRDVKAFVSSGILALHPRCRALRPLVLKTQIFR